MQAFIIDINTSYQKFEIGTKSSHFIVLSDIIEQKLSLDMLIQNLHQVSLDDSAKFLVF